MISPACGEDKRSASSLSSSPLIDPKRLFRWRSSSTGGLRKASGSGQSETTGRVISSEDGLDGG
jgi:hypothetical protein